MTQNIPLKDITCPSDHIYQSV